MSHTPWTHKRPTNFVVSDKLKGPGPSSSGDKGKKQQQEDRTPRSKEVQRLDALIGAVRKDDKIVKDPNGGCFCQGEYSLRYIRIYLTFFVHSARPSAVDLQPVVFFLWVDIVLDQSPPICLPTLRCATACRRSGLKACGTAERGTKRDSGSRSPRTGARTRSSQAGRGRIPHAPWRQIRGIRLILPCKRFSISHIHTDTDISQGYVAHRQSRCRHQLLYEPTSVKGADARKREGEGERARDYPCSSTTVGGPICEGR